MENNITVDAQQPRLAKESDEYVKIKIVIPPKLTSKEKGLFEKLAGESRFNPRELMNA